MKEISAGGVVYRRTPEHGLQIQLIQDRYGKVSLPKGKMEPGETVEETALREIAEETGLQGRIVEPIDQIKYQYRHEAKGLVDKEVHYYLVEATGVAAGAGRGDPRRRVVRAGGGLAPPEAVRLRQQRPHRGGCPQAARTEHQRHVRQRGRPRP